MTLVAARRAVVLGMVELERHDGQDAGWDLAQVLVAAKRQHQGPSRLPERNDVVGLQRAGLVHLRFRDGRYELSESARARAREGSL